MHWETKTLMIHFIAMVWNWTHIISEVCLYVSKEPMRSQILYK